MINDIEIARLLPSLSKRGPVIFLDSQSAGHPASQKSYIASLPEFELMAYGDEIIRKFNGKKSRGKGNPWEALKDFQAETDGWIFGYLGYDLKNHLEKLTSANPGRIGEPDMYVMNPGLIMELKDGQISVLKGAAPSPDSCYSNEGLVAGFDIKNLHPVTSEQEYIEKVRRAQDQITEGDFYEINLSHQMKGEFAGNSLALYNAMKQTGPVPFGAYLSFGDWSICSASPERFLGKRGSRVFSQPIKGTIHRGATGHEDLQLKKWLQSSEKNRAENLMIVDLVRNDLGRIALKGTVKVSKLFEIQSFETVHQMVSTIEAEAGDFHPVDIIKACFPMGSMTGAPKISAMKSIEEFENYKRGIYSGAIGYITPDEDFDFNVVIRTAIIKGNRLFYSVGGAITIDSDPNSEWEETLTKAKALTDIRIEGLKD